MNHLRKQILFLCDSLILIVFSTFFSWFSLRYDLTDAVGQSVQLIQNFALLYACTVLFQLLFRTYDSLWRYAESKEYLSLLMAAFCGFFLYEVLSRIFLQSIISFMLLTCVASLWVLGMLLLRFAYRVYRSRVLFSKGSHQIPVAIVGAGAAGVQLLDELQSNPDSRYSVQCFFDDDLGKLGKRIHGVEVKGTISQVQERLRAMDIQEIIVAIPSAGENRRHEILQKLSGLERIKISVLPSTLDMIRQKPMRSQLREVRIEDLLGREPVYLDPAPVDAYLSGKTVLVTGGGGSIGSELCRQLVSHKPKQLIIFDIYENNAYDIQQELKINYPDANVVTLIGSIRNVSRLESVFAQYKPDIVYHAAAHKHVPLMEVSPDEAVKNNVVGTWNVARMADKYGVKKFVMISTDKAVNPTNVMGATKRICEMIVQTYNEISKTDFVAVRFGNVLGSNGSVIPLFKRQIEAGGPVTVTDPNIIRYFMTIPEAVSLVLQAGAYAKGGELFILDMGEPVKIDDLAKNLIRLSGYTLGVNMEIKYTGLRPGEKLYEELLMKEEGLQETDNKLIHIGKPIEFDKENFFDNLEKLKEEAYSETGNIRESLKKVVDTYHPNEH